MKYNKKFLNKKYNKFFCNLFYFLDIRFLDFAGELLFDYIKKIKIFYFFPTSAISFEI